MLLGGTLEGKIFDCYGPRVLTTTETFLNVFGLMMASIPTRYCQILLSQSVCSGVGASMIFYAAFTCVRQAQVILNLPFLILSSGMIKLFSQRNEALLWVLLQLGPCSVASSFQDLRCFISFRRSDLAGPCECVLS